MNQEAYVSTAYLEGFQEYEQEMIAHNADEALEMIRVAIRDEPKYRIDPGYFSSSQVGDFTPQDRRRMIRWFGEVVRIRRLPPSFMFRAADVMDRFLSRTNLVSHAQSLLPPNGYPGSAITMVGLASMDIAVKAELGDGITSSLLASAGISHQHWAPILLTVWQGVDWIATNWTAYTFLEYLFFLLPREHFRTSKARSLTLAARLSFSIASLDASQLLRSQGPPTSQSSQGGRDLPGGRSPGRSLAGSFAGGVDDERVRYWTAELRSQQSQDAGSQPPEVSRSQGAANKPVADAGEPRRFTISTSTAPKAQDGTPEADSPGDGTAPHVTVPIFSQFCRDVCVNLHHILADAKFLQYTPSEQAGAALFVTMCTRIQDDAAHTAIIDLIHRLRDAVGLSVHNLKECARQLHVLISQQAKGKPKPVNPTGKPEAQARAKR